MKKLLGLGIIGALSLLAFPGHPQTADAQAPAVAQPPVSTNPEIAALQAQAAILQKQMAILNQKMDQILAKLSAPKAEPIPPPIALPAASVVQTTCTAACAPAQTTVSLMADACGSSGFASAGSTSCSSAPSIGMPMGRPGLFGRMRARRAARGAGGCGG